MIIRNKGTIIRINSLNRKNINELKLNKNIEDFNGSDNANKINKNNYNKKVFVLIIYKQEKKKHIFYCVLFWARKNNI